MSNLFRLPLEPVEIEQFRERWERVLGGSGPTRNLHRELVAAVDAARREHLDRVEETLRLFVFECYGLALASQITTRRHVLARLDTGACVYLDTWGSMSWRGRRKVADWLAFEPREWPHLGP